MKIEEITTLLNSQLFIAISSATISALIGYIIGLRKEKMMLRQKLEVETVDILLNLIVDASNSLSKIYSHIPFMILSFNSYYDNFEYEDKMVNAIWINIATGNVNNFRQSCLDYFYSATKTIRFAENRSIVLNEGFRTYTDEQIKLHTKFRTDTNLLTEELCELDILKKMKQENAISISDQESIKQALNNIEEDITMLQCLYRDFSTELQNHFIGRLYSPKRKIQLRKPQDKKFEVKQRDTKVKW